MTVDYAPPLTGAPARYGECLTLEAVRSGPAYIRTRGMTRWHRIRSSYLRLDHDGEVSQRWSFWCGQVTGTYRSPILADEPVKGEPRCGTCEGRAIGADPERPEWLFTPWTITKPDRCPGSGTQVCELQAGNRVGRCLFCGTMQPARGRGGPWNPTWGLVAHPPGEDLVTPCEFHAWRHMLVVDGRLACRCTVLPAGVPASEAGALWW